MVRKFFARDTRTVARDLLGTEFVRRIGSKTIRAIITETEAYKGFSDKASHASRGRTARNAPMFGPPGTLYIYLVYGMHWCLNIVTEREGYPAAVLIRGLWLRDSNTRLDGPGKLTKALAITGAFNNKNIIDLKDLSLGSQVLHKRNITTTPRIGVEYAGASSKKLWRFLLQ